MTYGFFEDPALLTPLASPIALTDGGAPADRIVYFGGPLPGAGYARSASNPGVDAITVSVVDAAEGTGAAPSNVRLASSAGGLDSATPGAPLSIGTVVAPGVPVPIYVRVTQGGLANGLYEDLSLQSSLIRETSA